MYTGVGVLQGDSGPLTLSQRVGLFVSFTFVPSLLTLSFLGPSLSGEEAGGSRGGGREPRRRTGVVVPTSTVGADPVPDRLPGVHNPDTLFWTRTVLESLSSRPLSVHRPSVGVSATSGMRDLSSRNEGVHPVERSRPRGGPSLARHTIESGPPALQWVV